MGPPSVRKIANLRLKVVPWGSFSPLREDVVASSKSKAEGGTGVAEEFWKWNEEQVKPYV